MNMFQICLFYTIFRPHSGESEENWSEDVHAIMSHITTPFKSLINQTVSADDIVYYLFNSSSPQTHSIIDGSNTRILSKSAKVVILIHGWSQDPNTQWYKTLREAFFEHDRGYYVIEVDWSLYSLKNYFAACNYSKDVGHLMGEFVAGLVKKNSVHLEQVVVVGHSLGGQVVGFLGKKVFEILGRKLKRIISLDPAGPLFEDRPPNERLAPTDAEVVHVIHTNGGHNGYSKKCGTIDFYPNGGSTQPGCLKEMIAAGVGGKMELCSHHRSWILFSEALRSRRSKFKSRRCANYDKFKNDLCNHTVHEEMGSLKTKKTGDFFLKTNATSPFSL